MEKRNMEVALNEVKGVMEMNKTQLRSLLSKQFGIKLSASDFKNASKEDLVNMIIKAKKDSVEKVNGLKAVESSVEVNNTVKVQNENKGEVEMKNEVKRNMELENLLSGDAFSGILEQMKEDTLDIKVHTTAESDRVINTLSNEIKGLKAVIAQMISNRATGVAGNRVSNVTKVQNPNTVSGKAAAKKGYIVCADCGLVVTSPKVVKYSKEHFGKVLCPKCQAKVRESNKKAKSNIAKDGSIVKTCMCCGKKIKFSSVQLLNEKSAAARERGLTPVACVECWKKEMAVKALLNNKAEQQQKSVSDKEVREIVRRAMHSVAATKVVQTPAETPSVENNAPTITVPETKDQMEFSEAPVQETPAPEVAPTPDVEVPETNAFDFSADPISVNATNKAF